MLQHPFSRGSVHIKSPDPQKHADINPNYLSHPLDMKMLAAIALHAQDVVRTQPLADLLVDNGTAYQPDYHELNASNAEAWMGDNLLTLYYPVGTCAMLPHDEGGVVDERFRVFGVKGLRIVDTSVFPMIPRANPQTLVYAIAERAAEFVHEDAMECRRRCFVVFAMLV